MKCMLGGTGPRGTRLVLLIINFFFAASYSGLLSVLTIILNPEKTTKFTRKFADKVDVTSVSEFFHSNAWLGVCTTMSGAVGGQLLGLIADR